MAGFGFARVCAAAAAACLLVAGLAGSGWVERLEPSGTVAASWLALAAVCAALSRAEARAVRRSRRRSRAGRAAPSGLSGDSVTEGER